MQPILNGYAFDPVQSHVRDRIEEIAGTERRRVEISGLITGKASLEDIEAELDAVFHAASEGDWSAELSLRPGRRLWVRREACVRRVSPETLTGAFDLTLEARHPDEESLSLQTFDWTITESGATCAFATAGTAPARPLIALTALGMLIQPSFSDGARLIIYDGVVPEGSTLSFDGLLGRVSLDGEDVTPYVTGEFPRVPPEGAVFSYEDDASSSHSATAVVSYRDRWW